MLHDFLVRQRDAIIERARAKAAERLVPVASSFEITEGVPLFLSQLTDLLRQEQREAPCPNVPTTDRRAREALGGAADRVGDDVLRAGLSVAQVVEGYGDVCQAILEHAVEEHERITPEEYRTLNLCLDVATAHAVTAFSRQRDHRIAEEGTERLGVLAHELRNVLSKAVLAYHALKRGAVGVESSTGALLGRSFQDMRDLIDRSLTEVRLAAALHNRERVRLAEFIEEIEVGATLDAKERNLELHVASGEHAVSVDVDPQLLASAVSNLMQNAMKLTPAGGRVSLSIRAEAGRVLIDIEDQCGGLPEGRADELFQPFERRSADRSGLGLGLKISRDAVKANGGEIRVRNLPGKGCIFRIDLPASV